jgi:hypothetical protein
MKANRIFIFFSIKISLPVSENRGKDACKRSEHGSHGLCTALMRFEGALLAGGWDFPGRHLAIE